MSAVVIVGFSTRLQKAHGEDGIIRFTPEHQVRADDVPHADWLRAYVKQNGYAPALPDAQWLCDPVYIYADDVPA